MARAIRLIDTPPPSRLPAKPIRWEQIRVEVNVINTNSSGHGACFPRHFGDDTLVKEKIVHVAEGMPGTHLGVNLQVHLTKDGFTVWAQGGKNEAFLQVAERAERIWVAVKAAWVAQHKNIT